jgi:hypothetical protein
MLDAREYVEGDQPLSFATEKFRSAFGAIFRAFAINYCALVVGIINDHIVLKNVRHEKDDENIQNLISRIFERNYLAPLSKTVHAEALITGQSAIIVWPDESGFPTFFPNRGDQIVVITDNDDPSAPIAAVKMWKIDDKNAGITVYFPDRIEKYAAETGLMETIVSKQSLERRRVSGEPWPVPNPYGRVPVFPLYNNRDLRGFSSEIRDIIPLQNALNKTWMDLLVAMEFQAIPLRWVAGLDVEIDPTTGRPVPPFVPGADRIWAVPYEGAKFGQFEPADLSPFLEVASGIVQHIAALSRIPVHYLIPPTAIWPSGEALWASMQGFERYIQTKRGEFGRSWQEAVQFALKIMGKNVDIEEMTVIWDSVAPVRDIEKYSAQLLKGRLGVPREQLLKEIGYSIDEVNRFMESMTAVVQDGMEEQISGGEFLREVPKEARPFVADEARET